MKGWAKSQKLQTTADSFQIIELVLVWKAIYCSSNSFIGLVLALAKLYGDTPVCKQIYSLNGWSFHVRIEIWTPKIKLELTLRTYLLWRFLRDTGVKPLLCSQYLSFDSSEVFNLRFNKSITFLHTRGQMRLVQLHWLPQVSISGMGVESNSSSRASANLLVSCWMNK